MRVCVRAAALSTPPVAADGPVRPAAATHWLGEDFVHVCQELHIVHDVHAGGLGCGVVGADGLDLCWGQESVDACHGHATPACRPTAISQHTSCAQLSWHFKACMLVMLLLLLLQSVC